MKFDRFFELAKKAGIEEAEFTFSSTSSLSFSLFHGEIDSYSNNKSFSFYARGIYKGKMGSISSDVYNNKMAEYFVEQIIANASVVENDDPVFIFKGSEKYRKINTFNRQLGNIPVEKKIEIAKQIERELKNADPRIVEVATVAYDETSNSTTIINTHGLKLSQKSNFFAYYGSAVAKEKEQTKTGFELYFGNDFEKFVPTDLVKAIAKETVSQLGGFPCESSTYKAVLAPSVVSSLMSAYVSSAIAEDVQKNSSLFIGKLGQKVASKKVTIEDLPINKTVFAKSFDDEGVATSNRAIIKNGVLQTYLYNLTTAAKDGVESTGNGVTSGSKVYTAPTYLKMKPGKKSQEELFKEIGNGVYITDVSGLHAGLNSRTGNFSLQSTGFLIKDGKIDHPLDIITVSGNLVTLFNSVSYVGNDSKEFMSGTNCPSVIVSKLVVSGK